MISLLVVRLHQKSLQVSFEVHCTKNVGDCLKNEVDLLSFDLSDISFPTSLMNLYHLVPIYPWFPHK